ncbi:CoA pyrophosphatase [Oryzomonas japonica]|uniref:CoA pyrophosphatase n=2 Tax=Oryzomonas TaxID=2855184 RepID=A0A5A9XK29_9BACT|nr:MULTISPECIES: CoA pyrophosphatase [Oryzomonas]KAA0893537.1 CoA pyrophosphatase [Oryzomonas rubra]KAB0667650.1 CoA pyrophosphatase [Oryzomonas japonica]
MTLTFDTICATISRLQHDEAPDDGRSPAAVAMVLVEQSAGLHLLFLERATDERDPWSGNLAFPGGRVEPGETLRQAAERETREEAAIELAAARHLGRLGDIVGAHLPVRIACFAYGFSGALPAVTINHESRDAFWVNLADLADQRRHITTQVHFRGRPVETPAIRLPQPDKPVLWGITYRLVMQFLKMHGLF